MRRFWFLLIIASFVASGCEKYNLKQPSYLSFSWELVNVENGNSTVTGGSFYPTRLELTGDREEGSDISIEQTLPAVEATFTSSSAVGVQIDVPMGKYTAMGLNMELDITKEIPVSVSGNATVQGTPVQFSIDWYKGIDLNFTAAQTFEFKKKEKYDMKLVLDCNKLLNGITQEQWDNAVVTNEPNGACVKISEYVNHDLFDIVEANISGALRIEQK